MSGLGSLAGYRSQKLLPDEIAQPRPLQQLLLGFARGSRLILFHRQKMRCRQGILLPLLLDFSLGRITPTCFRSIKTYRAFVIWGTLIKLWHFYTTS